MSTYTDLNNRMRENIVVGYSQNDRITTQKVRLFNEENEYWGTFKGHVAAEDIAIRGGIITGAILSDVALCGNIDLSGVNLPGIGQTIKALSNEIDQVQDNVDAEAKARDDADNRLKSLINSSDSRVEELCVDVYDDLKLSTNNLYQCIKTSSDNLTSLININQISALSAVQIEREDRISADEYLQSEINDLHTAIDAETADRQDKDSELCTLISSVNISSDNRYKLALSALSVHNNENIKQFAAVEDRLSNKIESDRHYEIYGQNDELLRSYPYKLHDYAVNIIRTSIKDKTVRDNEINGVDVAWISCGDNDSAIVQFYDLEADQRLQDALTPNQVFNFNGAETKATCKNNYYISYYPNDKIILATDFSEYYEVRANKSGDIIGKVRAAYTAADGSFISGRINIDTEDTQLTVFNAFQDKEFSRDNRILSIETEQVILNSDNRTFKLRKGVQDVNYCPIKANGVTVAEILEGNVKYIDHTVDEISVTIGAIGTNLVNLKAPDFRTNFNNQMLCCDTAAQTFSLYDVHAYYGYGYYLSSDVDFSGNCYGYVIPALENTTIDSETYTQVSVIIQGHRSTAINGTYLLDIDTGFNVRTWKNVTDFGGGNVLTVRFDGKYTLIDGVIDGAPIGTGKYLVKKHDPIIYNDPTAYNLKWTSTYTDWTVFAEHTTKDAGSFETTVSGPIHTQAKQFKLDIINDDINEIAVQIPSKKFASNSREFMLVEKFTTAYSRKIKLNILSEDGITPVKFFSERQSELSIETNKWTSFQFNEIAANRFFITDLDENNQVAQIKDLSAKYEMEKLARISDDLYLSGQISTEISNRISADLKLSSGLSTEIENRISDDLYLSGQISTEISNRISADLKLSSGLSTEIENRISDDLYLSGQISTEISNRISTDLYLSAQISSNTLSVNDIYDKIKGGLNYKGQVAVTDVPISVLDNTYQFCPTMIRDLFALAVTDDVYEALASKGWKRPDTSYTLDTELRNGWMYDVKALNNTSSVRFTLSGNDNKTIEITNKDYIIINTPGDDNGRIKIRDLSSVNVNVIDAEDADVVHTPALCAVSSIIALSVDRLNSKADAISGRIDELCAGISTDVQTVSADIISKVKIAHGSYDAGWIDGRDANLSILTLTNTKFNEYVENDNINDNCLYIISDDFIDVRGQIISNLAVGDADSAAVTRKYVNDISSSISADIKQLSSDLTSDVKYLSDEIIESNTQITKLQENLNLSVNNLSTDTLNLSIDYHHTFTSIDKKANNHISSDNLIITDPAEHTGSPDVHQKYYITMKYGTMVMVKI